MNTNSSIFFRLFLTETPKQKSGNKRLDRPAENLNVGHKHHDGCKTKLACLSAIVEHIKNCRGRHVKDALSQTTITCSKIRASSSSSPKGFRVM